MDNTNQETQDPTENLINQTENSSNNNNYNVNPVTMDTPQEIVTLGDWIVTILLQCIPIVNIIMLFIWAFSKKTNKNKSNYAKAQLIFVLIAFVISIAFGSAIMASIMSSIGMY